MSPNSQGTVAVTAAERARNVLARAVTAHVDWLDGSSPRNEVTGVILDRSDPRTATSRRPVVVEVADVAPLPVADRVRARVRLHGHAEPAPDRPGAIRLRVAAVELEENGSRTPVCPGDLRVAQPDPIATGEGAFLCHLVTDHADLVRTLTRLVDREALDGALRAVPLAVDRTGLTMRVEYGRGHRDVLLAFAEPATCFDEIRTGLGDLAIRARDCTESGRADPSGPRNWRILRDLLASNPAAARLCAPEDSA